MGSGKANFQKSNKTKHKRERKKAIGEKEAAHKTLQCDQNVSSKEMEEAFLGYFCARTSPILRRAFNIPMRTCRDLIYSWVNAFASACELFF